jgi:hypothetical protein
VSDNTQDGHEDAGETGGTKKSEGPIRRRRRGRQKRERLDTYLSHARNCHTKGLTVAQRKEEAIKIANSRSNLQESSRETYIYELNIVADLTLGPFIDRFLEIASDLHEIEVELCDIANKPASQRPRLQIIFVNRLCERALNVPGGISAAISEFMRELSTARAQLEAARKGQFALPL